MFANEECRPHIIYSRGNRKVGVGKDTIIVNITAARDCVSLKLGLCQVPKGACYAFAAERYPDVLKYRRRQTAIWDALTPEQIADDIKAIKAKEERRKNAVPIRYLRLQESGDFRDQADVDKASRVADLLRGVVHIYTYTARRDLDFSHHSTNLTINGSGFMVDNDFHVVTTLKPGPRCRGIAGGGCYGCVLCKQSAGRVIQEELRTGKRKKTTPTEVVQPDLTLDEHGGVAAEEKTFQVAPALPAKTQRRASAAPTMLAGLK